MNSTQQTGNNGNLNDLIVRLKKEDENYASLSKAFQVIYWVLSALFVVAVIRHAMAGSVYEVAGSACFLVAMVTFAILFRGYFKEYNNVDYSVPTLEMLKDAAYRYKPFQRKTFWALFSVLLVNAGLLLNTSFDEGWIRTQLIFMVALILAAIAGWILWITRYKPLRNNALQLIREIE